MKPKLIHILATVAILLVVVLLVVVWKRGQYSGPVRPTMSVTHDQSGPSELIKRSQAAKQVDTEEAESDDEGEKTDVAASAEVEVNEQVYQELLAIKDLLEKATDRTQRIALFARLRDLILENEEDGAAGAIARFLRSGVDAETGLEFKVGPDGSLESAPTLRTALLDLLGQVDPEIGYELSVEVMEQRTHPDEYAIGLRNIAWFDFDGDMQVELEQRFSDMVDQAEWLAQPTVGFLEAFDIAVKLATRKSFEDVLSVIRLEDQDGNLVQGGIARASFMAMDRIALQQPQLLIDIFADDPDFLHFAPDHRASLMSRLDITDPNGRAAFVSYLNFDRHGENELTYFTDIFPNGNYFVGNRLASSEEASPSITDLQGRDQRTLQVMEDLIADGEVSGEVATRIQTRLNEIVAEAGPVATEDPALTLP